MYKRWIKLVFEILKKSIYSALNSGCSFHEIDNVQLINALRRSEGESLND